MSADARQQASSFLAGLVRFLVGLIPVLQGTRSNASDEVPSDEVSAGSVGQIVEQLLEYARLLRSLILSLVQTQRAQLTTPQGQRSVAGTAEDADLRQQTSRFLADLVRFLVSLIRFLQDNEHQLR